MSPRNNQSGARTLRPATRLVICVCALLWTLNVIDVPRAAAENGFVTFYQSHISPADGDRCPMVPSCSAYAARAVEKHGLLLGWIMACDRLTRCGRDEAALSDKIEIDKKTYVLDTVEDNDFWWFSPKEKK